MRFYFPSIETVSAHDYSREPLNDFTREERFPQAVSRAVRPRKFKKETPGIDPEPPTQLFSIYAIGASRNALRCATSTQPQEESTTGQAEAVPDIHAPIDIGTIQQSRKRLMGVELLSQRDRRLVPIFELFR